MDEGIDKLFAGGAINSPIGRIIGMAEGNRTADGGFTVLSDGTRPYDGHRDPGNGAWNVGNYSVNGAYYKGSSPEEADRMYHPILKAEAERVAPLMRSAGLDPTNTLLMSSYLDIWNQSPKMAREGFIPTLPYLAKNGITPDTLLQARIYAGDAGVGVDGFNPTGVSHPELWANMEKHSEDQKRRMDEIVNAMQKIGIPTNGSLSGLPPPAIGGDKGFTTLDKSGTSPGGGSAPASLGTNNNSVIIGTYTRDCTKTAPWDWTMQMGKIYRGCTLKVTTLGIEGGQSTTPMYGSMSTKTTVATVTGSSNTGSSKPSMGGNTTPPKAGSLNNPVKGFPLTSPMGMRWGRMHQGVDFGTPIGTPIYAPADGVIGEKGVEAGYGNWLSVKHPGSSIGETFYAHMDRYAGLADGTSVKAGQLIGYTGNTGRGTGPHLHLEVYDNNNQRIDPCSVMEC